MQAPGLALVVGQAVLVSGLALVAGPAAQVPNLEQVVVLALALDPAPELVVAPVAQKLDLAQVVALAVPVPASDQALLSLLVDCYSCYSLDAFLPKRCNAVAL